MMWTKASDDFPAENRPVLVTWFNRSPMPCYRKIKNVPFVGMAIYLYGKWRWWDARTEDLTGQYWDKAENIAEAVDESIDIVAWMYLPDPFDEVRG